MTRRIGLASALRTTTRRLRSLIGTRTVFAPGSSRSSITISDMDSPLLSPSLRDLLLRQRTTSVRISVTSVCKWELIGMSLSTSEIHT